MTSSAPRLRIHYASTSLGLALSALIAALPACADVTDAPSAHLADAGADAADDAGQPDAGPSGCGPGKLTLPDGACAEPGVPPSACPPGDTEQGGACVAPGVPPSACAKGFQPTSDQGCAPVLPQDPCPKGAMAVPGEPACREVAPCEPGDYGAIPAGADAQFVNGAYAGGGSDGSLAKPWTTISAAISAAAPGAVIAIAAGSYVEDLDIKDKPVKLWGRCPALVAIQGTAAAYAAIHVEAGADGTEIRDLAITGIKAGFDQDNVEGVLLDRVWIHDTGGHGMYVDKSSQGGVGATVRRSLLEDVGKIGVYLWGGSLVMEDSVLRHVVPLPNYGIGVFASDTASDGRRSSFTLRGSIVERALISGLQIIGSDALIEASVVRDVGPEPGTDLNGHGIDAEQDFTTGQRSSLTVRGAVIERSHKVGVYVGGSDGAVEATSIRDTQAEVASGYFGQGAYVEGYADISGAEASLSIQTSLIAGSRQTGLYVRNASATAEQIVVRDTQPRVFDDVLGDAIDVDSSAMSGPPASLTIRRSRIENNVMAGILVRGSSLDCEGVAIHDTRSQDADGAFGWGIALFSDAKRRASATVRRSSITKSRSVGLMVSSADAEVEDTSIADTLPQASDGRYGFGVSIQVDLTLASPMGSTLMMRSSSVERSRGVGLLLLGSTGDIEGLAVRDTAVDPTIPGSGCGVAVEYEYIAGFPASMALRSSLIEGSHTAGVLVDGADATIDDTWVRDTLPDDGHFGDGLLVGLLDAASLPEPIFASAIVRRSRFEGSARAGISNFASSVDLADSALECNPIQMDGEAYSGFPFTFTDSGGSACGCDGIAQACKVLSAKLAPPTPLAVP